MTNVVPQKVFDEIRQGQLSKAAFDELKDMFETIEKNLHSQWANTLSADAAGREIVWLQLNALNQLAQQFQTDVDTGKMAQMELEGMNANSAKTNSAK